MSDEAFWFCIGWVAAWQARPLADAFARWAGNRAADWWIDRKRRKAGHRGQ